MQAATAPTVPKLPTQVFDSAQALIDAQLASPELRALLDAAEAAFARGDVDGARTRYAEIASTLGEVPVAELGSVRAMFQSGHFREAIAMGNLVAGENPGYGDALAMLAYMQDRAGYTAPSLAALERAHKGNPADPIVLAALAEILLDRGHAPDVITRLDLWLRSYPATHDLLQLRARADLQQDDVNGWSNWRGLARALPRSDRDGQWRQRYSDALPDAAALHVLANGVAIDGGRRVLTRPSMPFATNAALFVRNALGRVRGARVEQVDAPTGIAVLLLDVAFATSASIEARDIALTAVAGQCMSLAFPRASADELVFPRITPGFVVNTQIGTLPLLGATTRFDRHEGGALLLDAAGRFIGISVAEDARIDGVHDRTHSFGDGPLVVPIDTLRARGLLPLNPSPETSAHRDAALDIDKLYERLAPAVVQVIGAG